MVHFPSENTHRDAVKPVLDVDGARLTLVGTSETGGVSLLGWVNDGLEGGTHDLVVRCLAEREIHLLRTALEAIDALEVMEINPDNYDHEDLAQLNDCASEAKRIAGLALGYGREDQ